MNEDGAGTLGFDQGSVAVDPSIRKELPKGCNVVSTNTHGKSFFAKTGRIDIFLQDGSGQAYYIKVLSRKDKGKDMVRSEFESMSAISQVVLDVVPRPIAWGTYETIPDTHFLLCEFRHMETDAMPSPKHFAASLAKLHKGSQSPNGMFGFGITTYAGNLPQMVAWEKSWEAFFAKSLKWALNLEIAARGGRPDEELGTLMSILFEKVIPRLLRPLETEGRTVKPALVHGDLWYANSGVDKESGQPLIFDACCFYAHNEYEFGQWRPACNKFGSNYIEEYTNLVEPSEPKEDFEGRLDLYRLRFDTHVSALFPDKEDLRKQVIEVTRDLVERYGGCK